MTTPLGAPSGATTSPSATARTTRPGESAMGPDAFMKLLVAQLKYQNPMAPADGQAYMTQMATFTQVEKLDQLVKAQVEAQAWQQRVSAEGLVGRTVTGTVDGTTTTGTVVGVRYGATGPVLELGDGRTLAAAAVERVQQASGAGSASSTAPPASNGTTGSSTTSGGTTTGSTTPGSTTPGSTTTSSDSTSGSTSPTTSTAGSGTSTASDSTTAPSAGTPSA